MPKVIHPRYPAMLTSPPVALSDIIHSKMSMREFQDLPHKMGLTPAWLGRKLANPVTFTVQEAHVLAAALNMSVSDLALHYAVGLDEMTAGDILNILLEEGHLNPYAHASAAAPALPVMGGKGAGTVAPCRYCGVVNAEPDEMCYKAPQQP